MARKNFFLSYAIFVSVSAQLLNAQTYKTGNLSKDIQLRERLFRERKTFAREFSNYKEQQPNSLEDVQVSDEQIVYRYVSALAISPNFANDNTIIAAVANTGLYRSNDIGMTWQPINSGLEFSRLGNTWRHDDITINCIDFSPNYANDNTIFVGAVASLGSGHGALYKSENKGDEWREITHYGTASIAFSPNYLTDSTIYRSGEEYSISRDGGKTWQNYANPGSAPGVNFLHDISLSPYFASDSIVFLAGGLGYYKSTNGGRTWNQLFGSRSALPASEPVDCINFFPIANAPNLALAGTIYGLYQIAYEDTLWQPVDPQRVILVESVSEIIFSPNYESDNVIFVSTAAGIFKSTDGGQTWSPQNEALTDPYVEAFVMSPNFENDHILVIGTHDGVFISNTPQIAWRPRNNGLPSSFGVKNITQNPYQLDHSPRIASNGDDTLHLFWKGIHFSSTKGDLVNDTFYQKFSDGNESPVFKLPTPLESFGWGNFEVDADRDGFVHLLLSGGDTPVESTTYYLTNRSGDFNMHVFVSSDALRGSLRADKDGYAHIIGRAPFGAGYLYYSNNKTGQFKTVELTNLPPHSFTAGEVDYETTLPRMQIDSNDIIHLFYPGRLPAYTYFYYSNNENGDFSEFTTVSDSGSGGVSSSGGFSVVVDKANSPHFVYKNSFGFGRYRRLIGDSLSSTIGFSAGGVIAGAVIDENDKIHLSTANGSNYLTIKNDQVSETISPKGFATDFTVRGGGLAITGEDNIHIVRSQRSNNIKSDFDFDVYLISFRSNSNTGHIAYGSLANPDNTIPLDKDVSFRAYLQSNPEDTVTQNAVGCGYKNGNWFIQCASFVNQWQPGDTLHVEFTNTSSGENSCAEGVLTEADTDLFPKAILGNLAPNAFHLLFPANLDTIRADSIIFKWREATDPNPCDAVSYTLIYDTTSSFLQPTFVSNLSDTLFVLKNGLLEARRYFWTVNAQDNASLTTTSLDTFSFFKHALSTDIEDNHSLATPTTYNLHQNYPNPFNPETVIKYQLPKLSGVKIDLYNLLGQKVRTLVDEEKPTGFYSVKWDGHDHTGKAVSGGVYIMRLEADDFIKSRKIMLIK